MTSNSPIFVVGCSRSGTTMLQSFIASNEELYAQPETNVLYRVADDLNYRRFGRLIGRRSIPPMLVRGAVNRLGYTPSFSWRGYLNHVPPAFAAEIERRNLGIERRIARIYRQFGDIMNTLAHGGRWIEKTPQNLFVLDYLEKHFPDAKFVHIVRSPLDNIASIMDAASRHEHFQDRFGGENGLEKAIAFYNCAYAVTASRRSSSRHLIVGYEQLVDDAANYLRQVEAFLSLEPNTLKAIYDPSGIAGDNEVWKHERRKVVRAKSKAKAMFSPEQIAYIRRHTKPSERSGKIFTELSTAAS